MADIEKICNAAGRIIEYLNGSFEDNGKIDNLFVLAFGSALAGISCFEASKALDCTFMHVDTGLGEKFYFSEKANEFLFASEYSISSCILGFCNHINPESPLPSLDSAQMKIATAVGNPNYLICDMIEPRPLFENAKRCWDDFYVNILEGKFTPEEWPLLFGVVVQNLMSSAIGEMSLDQLAQFSFECACYVSKIGPDTYKI